MTVIQTHFAGMCVCVCVAQDDDEGLSDYELQRRRNIMENKALLQDLLQGETLTSLKPPPKKKIK